MKHIREAAPAGLRLALLIAFPFLLVLICEFNTLQDLPALFALVAGRPGALLFSVLLTGAVFACLLLIVKRGWIAALPVGVLWYVMSCVEFFKYDVSGSHFTPADMVLAGKLSEAADMAKLRFTPGIIVCVLLLAAYIAALWFFRAELRLRPAARFPAAAGCLAFAVTAVLTPWLSALCGVDRTETVNMYAARAKFSEDGFIAFYADETRALASTRLKAPKGYSGETVGELLAKKTGPDAAGKKPNVIVVLSESFADFRVFESLGAGGDIYESFDRMASEGAGGRAVVPAFGGYTTKSEFEMINGLPIASLNDPIEPENNIGRETLEAMPTLWRELGYRTVYLHPYHSDYYNRDEFYPKYGFDSLYFRGELYNDSYAYRSYGDDKMVFDRALSELEGSDAPVYIHIMSMQNHQPYYFGAEQGQSELEYYLEGVKNTDRRLGELLDALEQSAEPTLVFFVGDHMPFFSGGEENVYDSLGIDLTDCAVVYEQRFAVWSNYGADLSAFSDVKYSLFYFPHLLMAEAAGDEQPAFSAAVLECAETSPVYTRPYQSADEFVKNPALELFTWDRLNGGGFSYLK